MQHMQDKKAVQTQPEVLEKTFDQLLDQAAPQNSYEGIQVCVCVCVCKVQNGIYINTHTHLHTRKKRMSLAGLVSPKSYNTYIHTYIHTHIHTSVETG
jgi:hypothetical protein